MTDKIKIRVDASTPGSAPKQTSPNAAKPTRISSDSFEGDILVRIKDFTGESADGAAKLNPADGYFADDGERRGKTWSIFVRGRFLEEVNGQFSIHADDILFGNTFERPIRDHLPWGTAVALKFLRLIDNQLQQDFYADKPWAFSPLVSTAPYLSVTRLGKPALPAWSDDTLKPLKETTIDSFIAAVARSPETEAKTEELEQFKEQGVWDTAKRRSWLALEENRKAITLGPNDLLEMDFVQGYLDFNDLSVGIPSIGFHIKLKDYWDGQPVTFTCCNRARTKTYFTVVFQIVDMQPTVKGAVVEPMPTAGPEDTKDIEISDEVD